MDSIRQTRFWNRMIVVFSIIALIAVSFIFHNSFQNIEDSTERSSKVSESIQSVVDPKSEIEEKDFHEGVRKTAHGIEFAILGIAISGLMISIYKRFHRSFVGFALFLLLAVAVCDEFIQNFNDRSSQISDVLIDFGGAVAGFLLLILVALLVSHFRKKHARKGL